jgi:ribosomal protein S27E
MSVKNKSTKPPKGYKKLQCKYCDNISDRVDEKATAITCWQCTQKLVGGQHLEVRK